MYIRQPAVAGSFYPGNPDILRKNISEYLKSAADLPAGIDCSRVLGIVSPHAGYVYSGPVAAYGFKCLEKSRFNKFIIIAPSHYGRFNGASIIPEGIFKTPLGDAVIDSTLGRSLVKREYFSMIIAAHGSEHSLEVQIPFLQMVKPEAEIVPLVIGTIDPDICRKIGETIAAEVRSAGGEYGIIISTDLSHYHPYDEAVIKDRAFINALESFNEKNVYDVLSTGRAEACGEGGILAGIALAAGLGAEKIQVIKYANSGDTAGSKDQVVGYLSALILD